MKKIGLFAVTLITAFFLLSNLTNKNKTILSDEKEIRGVFISYIEYMKYFQNKDKEIIKVEIENMIKTAKKYHFNTIYLQVRPFSDSIYDSNIFPFTHTISGIQGKKIDLDVLEYFLNIAHQNNLKVHAWINPYRISNETDTSFLSTSNPAYLLLSTNDVKVIEGKGIYYNPASSKVKELIINGVKEIVINYDIDAIMLDDYFYPDDTIDLENYKEVENTISLTDFRLSQTNELVFSIYKEIKKIKPNVLLGISPDGNLENNYDTHYIDVKTWLKEENYIDYIMPQIYYGFLNEKKPFIQTVNEWNNLIKNNTKLVVALSLYKVGNLDKYAGSGIEEWILSNDIIKKQIQVVRNLSNYNGFSIFRYDYFSNDADNKILKEEIKNYCMLLEK